MLVSSGSPCHMSCYVHNFNGAAKEILQASKAGRQQLTSEFFYVISHINSLFVRISCTDGKIARLPEWLF